MGGALSEPATLVDLGECTRGLYVGGPEAAASGWARPGFATQELVAGLQHVGDAVLLSHVYCPDCLAAGLRKVWPQDVGATLEESGPRVRFLHSLLLVERGCELVVRPFVANSRFSRGLDASPWRAWRPTLAALHTRAQTCSHTFMPRYICVTTFPWAI